ncbi:MAG: hypothetical protein PVSMB1_15060 [Gemmatimonadaceae bacterium]
MRDHAFDVVLLRHFLLDERRHADHRIQQIQQIVADNAHEIIARGHRLVGSRAFVGQVVVGRLAFLRQKGHVLGSLVTEDVVRGHALPLENAVFNGSRCLQRVRRLMASRRLIDLGTGSGQQRVGTCSRAADDRVRGFIGGRDLIVKRTIGTLAFET